MKSSVAFMFRVITVLLFLSTLNNAIYSQENNNIETQRQVLNDLCTLSLFMKGVQKLNSTWTVVDNLLGEEPYLKHSQPRYSFLETVYSLSKIHSGTKFTDAIDSVFSELASTDKVSVIRAKICDPSDVKTPSWIQLNISEAAYYNVFPGLNKEIGVIKGTAFNSIEDKVNHAVSTYINRGYDNRRNEIYEISEHGKSIIDKILKHDYSEYKPGQTFIFEPNLVTLNESLKKLNMVDDQEKNPLYWHFDYFAPIGHPTTPYVWKWYTESLPWIQELYKDAIYHIEKGTFQDWWKNNCFPQE